MRVCVSGESDFSFHLTHCAREALSPEVFSSLLECDTLTLSGLKEPPPPWGIQSGNNFVTAALPFIAVSAGVFPGETQQDAAPHLCVKE